MRINRGCQTELRARCRWMAGLLAVTLALHLAGRAGAGLPDPPPHGRSVVMGEVGPVDVTPEDITRGAACLGGRATAHLDGIARIAGPSVEQLERLRAALGELVEDVVQEVRRSPKGADPFWVESGWSTLLASQEWTLALEEELKVDQRAGLEADLAARGDRVVAASVEVLVTALAVELRLREAQAEELREPIVEWMGDPRWRRARSTSPDLTSTLASSGPVSALLVHEQVSRLVRMRLAMKRSAGGRQPSTLLGGRYPEDEFVLEALSLAAFHGWDDEQAALLVRGATAMGREVRRGDGKRPLTGERNLLREVVDLDQQPLWKALVRREEARHGVDGAAPAPWRSGDRKVLVDARSQLMLAHLDRLLLLEDGPREALGAALRREVNREVDRGAVGLGAIGTAPIWRALRLPLRFNAAEAATQPRPEFLADLNHQLSAAQLRALGVEEEG